MKSSQLRTIVRGWGNLSDWYFLSPDNEKEILNATPEVSGTYILRLANRSFGRLKGCSDILYIGSAKNLRRRIRQYFHPGPKQLTNRRIRRMMETYPIEAAWCLTENFESLEHQLLRRYLKNHDELPPFNHAEKRKLSLVLKEEIRLSNKIDSKSK